MKIEALLAEATKKGRCLSAEQVAGIADPGFVFRVMGVLERLVANRIAGEAEAKNGRKRYFLRSGESELVAKGVLSKGAHVHISVPVRDGTVLVGRMDEGDVSEKEWGGILGDDADTIVSVAKNRGIVGENDRVIGRKRN